MSKCCCPPYSCYCGHYQCKKPYSFFNFMFDLFMIAITCGAWLLWIIIRELRN